VKRKYWLSLFFAVLAAGLLFLPLTYYGFIDYIVENTVINMNLDKDTLETEKAAVAIFNGAGLNFIPEWLLHLLAILGGASVYFAIAIPIFGNKIFSKEYWTTFSLVR